MNDLSDKAQRLDRYLANLGYGTRKQVTALVRTGRVTYGDNALSDPAAKVIPVRDHLHLRLDGQALDPMPPLTVIVHKPAGYVCSHVSDDGPSISGLLPQRLCARKPGLGIAGRLDKDATGLVVLTQDGQWAHKLMRNDHAKIYDVELAESLREDIHEILASGTLMLKGDTKPLKPVRCEISGARTARLTLYEGRYHQVKRMFAALGNRVVRLHRTGIGDIALGDLPEGAYRIL